MVLFASPVGAGGTVTFDCAGQEREFLVGTGRQFRGQGLELWPMVCLTTGQLASYARVMDAERFARLERLAGQRARDGDELALWLQDNPDKAGLVSPDMFGQAEELTFGDIRGSVSSAARPTEETILDTRFVYWVQSTCVGRLVPIDFYLETGAPCPACEGGKLRRTPKTGQPDWD